MRNTEPREVVSLFSDLFTCTPTPPQEDKKVELILNLSIMEIQFGWTQPSATLEPVEGSVTQQ